MHGSVSVGNWLIILGSNQNASGLPNVYIFFSFVQSFVLNYSKELDTNKQTSLSCLHVQEFG